VFGLVGFCLKSIIANLLYIMNAQTQNLQSIKDVWFEEFIAAIRTHQLQLETNTAPEELRRLYGVFINGNATDLAVLSKMNANQHFIKNVIVEYLQEISKKLPIRLAFDLDDSEVLVWAEINDDDEEMENFLLLAEAKVNANYHKYGYDLTSTIVEVRDGLSIPNHYSIFKG
jgi:hypothetical protein